MAEETTVIDSPIDVMFLLHKASLGMTAHMETLASGLEDGGDVREFTAILHFWARLLRYHVEAGDAYVTRPLVVCKAARANEAEHALLVKQAGELICLVTGCDGGLGGRADSDRTGRRVYGQVVALRVAEVDHFENEETFVLPVVRERMTDTQQLEIAGRLLIDEGSEAPRWIMEWLAADLSAPGRAMLEALETFIEAACADAVA